MAETFDFITVTTPNGSVQYKAPPMAAEFSALTNYAAGDYCTYQGALYRFSAAHAAGAWTGTDATVVSLAGDVSDLRSAFDLDSLTPGVKSALLNLLEHVAYIDEDGQDYYDALYDALYNRYWEVTNNLTNCTTSNASEQTLKSGAYSATITAAAGYVMSGATVSITMGGTDITATAYSNGTISISAVTGALVITISAAAVGISSITAVYTQPGTIYPTDSIAELKDDLVVTATYDDSTTAVIPAADYTLSGTLAAGTSTITVTYSGKTTTFSVTVTEWDFAWDYSMGKLEEQDGWGVDKSSSGISSSLVSNGEKVTQTTANKYFQWYMPSSGSLSSCRTMSNGYGVIETIVSGVWHPDNDNRGHFRVYAAKDSTARIVVMQNVGKWRIQNNATGTDCTPIADAVDNTDYTIRLVMKNTTADVYINGTLVAEDVDTSTMTSGTSNGCIAIPGYASGYDYAVTLKAVRIKVGA